MQLKEHISQVIAILGVGVTGISVAKFLQSRDLNFVFLDTCPQTSTSALEKVTKLGI